MKQNPIRNINIVNKKKHILARFDGTSKKKQFLIVTYYK